MSGSPTPIRELIDEEHIPTDFFSASDGLLTSVLDKLFFTQYSPVTDRDGIGLLIDLVVAEEVAISLPGLEGFKIVFGSDDTGLTTISASFFAGSKGVYASFRDLTISVRFPPTILKPVPESPEAIAAPHSQIDVTGSLFVDENFDVRIEGFDSIRLKPAMVGDSGIIISADDVRFDLSRTTALPEVIAAGFDESFIGVFVGEAQVKLPEGLPELVPEDLVLENAAIGSGGVSGRLEAPFSFEFDNNTLTYSGEGGGEFFGIPFGVSNILLDVQQNAFRESSITGELLLPFFDRRVAIDVGLTLDGSFTTRITGPVESDDTFESSTGLFTLHKEDVLKLELESIGFEVEEGELTTKLSGQVTPLFGEDQGLDWPSFAVEELEIDAEGNVHLDGGWLDLREQYSLDFQGFQMEITKLGFGKTEDGGKWMGFSGGLKLVDGLPVGTSVEGLRIVWYEDDDGNAIDTELTFNGVGVELDVPDVLHFKGAVSYDADIDQFAGDIELDLISLDLEVDGTLVFGQLDGDNYMALYLATELPSGIPLWSTGLALYGMAGLFALDMEPNKLASEGWYENPDGSDGWYKRTPTGITDLVNKWEFSQDSLALGAGITIGTVSDNGYAFSGKTLLAIVFPGPVLLIEGRANLLAERAELDGGEPNFRALGVLDNRAGNFLFGLDAQYTHDENGKLIDIRGGAEAFFDFHDANLWHLYLGEREPREKRIRADVFRLFEAEAYLMLDADQLATGAWVGYDKDWKFGPLRVAVEAWIEGNAVVSWKPTHFHGDLWLHGKAELSVWRFGTGLTVDAQIAADVFDPFHVLGEFSVGIKTPWPLPNFSEDVLLEWGPEPTPPPLPLPLKEIAIEHSKVTTSWPLPRGEFLLPNYDGDDDGFLGDPVGADQPSELDDLPVVPLDGRPHLTFSRSVHDDAGIGGNPHPVAPEYERIGDPAKNEGPVRVRYGLKAVALEKRVDGNWEVAAQTPEDSENPKLYGSWAPVPAMPDGGGEGVAQTKLWLWSKTPFDYTRHSGRSWEEWFTDRFTEYPCVPIPPDQEICCDFEGIEPDQAITSPWECPDHPEMVLTWDAPNGHQVMDLDEPVDGSIRALCLQQPIPDELVNEVAIDLLEPAKAVTVTIVTGFEFEAVGSDADGNEHSPSIERNADQHRLRFDAPELDSVVIRVQGGPVCVVETCAVLGVSDEERIQREEMEQHLRDELARWAQEGEVMEPHTTYRLKVVTTLQAEGEAELADFSRDLEQTEYTYFRTEGPPGLTDLSTPVGHPTPDEFDSGLDDLSRYVHQTVPATAPEVGEKPVLPRPVYRAYDVGAEFDEECRYVELMYRLDGRDLGLYLYDNNDQPVRDAQGRLIVLSNRWGDTEELRLAESDERWITLINASDCATLDTTVIPHSKTLTSVAEGQVLDPDTVYEARLMPLLLHEDFSGDLAGWETVDEGDNDGPANWDVSSHESLQGEEATVTESVVSLDGLPDLSVLEPNVDTIILEDDTARSSGLYGIVSVDDAAKTVTVDGEPDLSNGSSAWEIPALGAVVQTSNIWGGTQDAKAAQKPGTMLLRGRPDWTDYRVSVILRSTDDDAIGLVFRYLDTDHYYRFSMDRQRRYRRVVRVVDGIHTILAEDEFVYRQGQDYLITVEAIGSSLRVYQDGELVFDVTDDSMDQGRIGLYCWGNIGARFSDVRVDDFRPQAPVVYRFQFTSSQFADFFHHLHSFQDETWQVDLEAGPSEAEISELIEQAVAPATTPSEEEARAYETLAEHVLGQAARQNPPEVQVTRVERAGEARAFLVQSPEPIDWKRTVLNVLHAQRGVPHPELPDTVKLTDVRFGVTRPNEESVTVLLREAVDLTGHRIEYQRLPGPVVEPADDPVLFEEEFESMESGLLFRETFGPDALDQYTIVDEGTDLGPSVWDVSDGHIVQTSNIFGGSVSGSVPDKPGTIALTGSPSWTDVRINAVLRSEDDDAIGIVFRYIDIDNYYRFSMDRERSYRRLIKKVDGDITVLWEDDVVYNLGQSYRLTLETYGDRFLGYIDETLLFSVQDSNINAGRVGLYCWANTGAHFEGLSVETLEVPPVLWEPAFADLNEVEVVDEPAAIDGPSEWTVEDGVLVQSSNIHVEVDTPHQPGTYALGGDEEWEDVQVSARLRSDDEGSIGIMFRVSSQLGPNGEEQGHDYYRFSMDRESSDRRLVKKVGDTVTVLWQDSVQYTVGQTYHLTIRAVGDELRGFLDGVPLFSAHDSDLKHGRIGLSCSANTGAHFDHLLVSDRTRSVDRWSIHDEGTIGAPSVWRIKGGALLQLSDIFGGSSSGSDPAKPGTHAITGDPAWTDYRFSVRLRSDEDDAVGVILRYVDEDNYYRLSLDAQRSYRRLVKKENGVISVLWEDTGGYTVGEPFTLTVDAIGSRLVGFLRNARLFDLEDDSHATGLVGLYCWDNSSARFERVEVRRPPLEAYALLRDRFAAGDTSDWSFVNEGTEAAPSDWHISEGVLHQTSNIHSLPVDRETLDKKGTQAVAGDPSWTDVVVTARLRSLDDDAIGLLFRYADADNYYRFSMDSQRGYRRLVKNVEGTFSLLWEDDFSYEVGRTYEVTLIIIGNTLRGYLDGRPMFVVEDSDLAAGRMGLYCWENDDSRFSAVSVYPAALVFDGWLLDEPFDVQIPDRWTFVDEGDQEGPSEWEMVGGELHQTSSIFGGSTDGSVPAKPGTYALGGDSDWSDYRVSARLRSDDENAIGLMFRYQDAENYYRFSMDRQQSYRRLIKKVAGEVTVLWEDASQYDTGREYILTLVCVGERLTGYLDGVELFDVDDSDLASGRIGLYCWRNTGARFAEVRVTEPAWTPYYIFGQEERLPAGTRVQVHAGNVADAPPDESSIIRRFTASLDERGQLHLPREGVNLRVRSPSGIGGHGRYFLPHSDYAPVDDPLVLRNADGTGFFLLPSPAGSVLPSSQYRLRMTYLRDNRPSDPDSQVLSQAGNSDPEHVTFDLSWEPNR